MIAAVERKIPIVFCEPRALAQEWRYRFLGAALAHVTEHEAADELAARLSVSDPSGGSATSCRSPSVHESTRQAVRPLPQAQLLV